MFTVFIAAFIILALHALTGQYIQPVYRERRGGGGGARDEAHGGPRSSEYRAHGGARDC
jgi:hypothetical protein